MYKINLVLVLICLAAVVECFPQESKIDKSDAENHPNEKSDSNKNDLAAASTRDEHTSISAVKPSETITLLPEPHLVSPNSSTSTSTTSSPANSTTATSTTPTTPTTSPKSTPPTQSTTPITPTHSTKPAPRPSSSTPMTSTISPSTTESPSKPDRSFDISSFLGGVILALGIIAIAYVVYKFYKTRSDQSYRTL